MKPEITKYIIDGSYKEVYLVNGQIHRENGSALIWYDENDQVICETYYINGQCHREDGPAKIEYYENGKVKYEEYWINGQRHREDGPAWIKHENRFSGLQRRYICI